MIVSEGSTFAEIPWLFGGGQARVMVVSPSPARRLLHYGVFHVFHWLPRRTQLSLGRQQVARE